MNDITINRAAEIRLRAERKLGEVLKATEKNKGTKGQGRPMKGGTKREPPKDKTPTLAESGISKKESSRAQELASVPDEEFEVLRIGARRRSTIASPSRFDPSGPTAAMHWIKPRRKAVYDPTVCHTEFRAAPKRYTRRDPTVSTVFLDGVHFCGKGSAANKLKICLHFGVFLCHFSKQKSKTSLTSASNWPTAPARSSKMPSWKSAH